MPGLKGLEHLKGLPDSDIEPPWCPGHGRGVKKLQQALPNCQIIH